MTTPNLSPNAAAVQPQQQQPLYIADDVLCTRWNISKVSLWRLRKRDPRCPRPFKGFTAWRNLNLLTEIEAYEQILHAERDATAAIAAERSEARKRAAAAAAAVRKREARKREDRALK